MLTFLFLAAAFVAILGGALLFTNAVEWLGHRLELGTGSVGSVLAAVSTALPESLIPVVAIVGGAERSQDVAIGAIVGAPFMLATIAMALVGLFALAFAGSREQGRALRAHRPTLRRDLAFFVAFFGAVLALGLGAPREARVVVAVVLVASYVLYLSLTIRRGGEVQPSEALEPLTFDPTRHTPPMTWMIVAQFVVGLGALIGGAHLFVQELLAVAEAVEVSPLVLSLLLSPLATELPEKANSLLWIRQGKDAFALGNITGAMVFQATLPASIGLAFTDWQLDRVVLLAGALAIAGAAIAFWTLLMRRRFTTPAILAWGCLFSAFVAVVAIGAL